MTEPRRIILDCDPGHDDALAIMLAAGDARIDLVGITTVAGNQTVEKTTRNACSVATLARLHHTPIVSGAGQPLLRSLRVAPEIHGMSGLDGPPPVAPTVHPRSGHACDFLIEQVMASPGDLTIVATGPLTNVALALLKEPAMAEAARELVIMGGAYGRGNWTPAAEFNIYVDPEAASVAFGASWRVTMIGLDVTHQALCSEELQSRISAVGSSLGVFAGQLLEFFRGTYRREQLMPDPPVHDACAVAYVIDPDLFQTRPAHVVIETCGTHTSGMTVVEFVTDGGDSRQHVGISLRRDAFFDLLVGAIVTLG